MAKRRKSGLSQEALNELALYVEAGRIGNYPEVKEPKRFEKEELDRLGRFQKFLAAAKVEETRLGRDLTEKEAAELFKFLQEE